MITDHLLKRIKRKLIRYNFDCLFFFLNIGFDVKLPFFSFKKHLPHPFNDMAISYLMLQPTIGVKLFDILN